MDKVDLTVSVEQMKLTAMDFYLGKNGGSVQKELQKRVQELYEQTVPEPTREYLDFMTKPQPSRSHSKKPTPKVAAEPASDLRQSPGPNTEAMHDG